MIDKRKCYRMENGYGSSDFTFYKKFDETVEGSQHRVYELQREAGNPNWYFKSSYVYRSARNTGFTEQVLVLVNDAGHQIETAGYGWYGVQTEYEKKLKERKAYEKFLTALQGAGKLAPNGANRWFNEAVLENFENEFEEILYYGEEDA